MFRLKLALPLQALPMSARVPGPHFLALISPAHRLLPGRSA